MLSSALAVLALVLAQTPPQETWSAKNVKVLYAGAPGDEREEAFMVFLESWFEHTHAIGLEELDAKTAAPYDVVIADWTRQYRNGDTVDGADPRGSLGASFTKPVILIGAVAGTIQRHSKIDWL